MRPVLLLFALITVASSQSDEKLKELFKQYTEDRYRELPEIATLRGRNEYNDRWTDWSRAGIDRRAGKRQEYLRQLRPFLNASLSDQDKLSVQLLQYFLEREIETEPLDLYLLRVGQLVGVHNNVFRTIDAMPQNTVRDYENIIKRLQAVPVYVDQNIAILNESIARGLLQPSLVVDRVLAQLRNQAAQKPDDAELLSAFRRWPSSIPENERQRLSAQASKTYNEAFVPAWQKFVDFFEKTYAPKARPAIALSSLDGGPKYYAAQVRSLTTTTLTPQQIHELGKSEVQRIEGEMLAIARERGFEGPLHEYEKKLAGSPDQRFHSKDEMLAYCRNVAKIVEPELPRLFKHIPRLLYGIRAIPAAVEASTASNAQSPSQDWSRPGWFNLNTFEPEKQVKFDKEALVLHEAVPGHIFQGSVALEAGDLPEFRRGGGARLSAFSEGWALYVESLGSELGVYLDPASRFGRFDSERFRAARLVVDTGMHALGWSRSQAVDYFATHAPNEDLAEIDRYISWPAQALSYKMGQLKIFELRKRAEKELGPSSTFAISRRGFAKRGRPARDVGTDREQLYKGEAVNQTALFMNTECNRIADQLRRAFSGDPWHGPPLREILAGITRGAGACAAIAVRTQYLGTRSAYWA